MKCLAIGSILTVVMTHKVKNVVHVMMENRSFDSIYGYVNHTSDIDNLNGKPPFCNHVNVKDPNSVKVCTSPNQVDSTIYGPNHGYRQTTEQLYGTDDPSVPLPKVAPMNGFAQQGSKGAYQNADTASLAQVMQGFNPDKIPIARTLASEFAIFDKWFASVPGPTQPNRIFSHCATSSGWYNNDRDNLIKGNPCRPIQKDLADAGLTWKNYYQEVPSYFFVRETRLDMLTRSKLWFEFKIDAKNGKLPNYSFLEPTFGELPNNNKNSNDGHAGGTQFHNAETFLKDLYETLRRSPQWESTLLIITYDEHGGFYDHVAPPTAPNPDGITTVDKDDKNVVYSYDRLGVRVPVTLVSPWIPKGMVIHEPNGPQNDSQFEHSSIPATLRSIFNLKSGPLTKRESWAGKFDSYLLDSPRLDCRMTLPNAVISGF
ncbi:phosphoesterase [Globomyces pollinis-pini]|nr:phosphoesterase [Globomyces pollinis-pini]